MMEFAKRLKELRVERGLSQMELSVATGISQSAIAKWELSKTEPTASALITLSKFFNESVDYLLGITD
ncbi:MAG: helix-turn-helix transcriptional regulator [Clostridia bacterium]|nr:helix-turn-helix transcriptional regulator [Clostridia bacterium]